MKTYNQFINENKSEFSFDEKKELTQILRSPIMSVVVGTKLDKKYGNAFPMNNFSDEMFDILIDAVIELNLDFNSEINRFDKWKKDLESQIVIKDNEDPMKYFNPSTGELRGHASEQEKKSSIKSIQDKIDLLEKFKNFIQNKNDN